MKTCQEWMLAFSLLLYFTKSLKCDQQSSWSTVAEGYGMRTAVVPESTKYSTIFRTNSTDDQGTERAQTYKDKTSANDYANTWPFIRNFTLPSEKYRKNEEIMSASDEFQWPQNLQNNPTFFYTHVEPHRFEYRAMFQHNHNGFKPQNFHPFVDDFPPFPKMTFPPFPKFPSFPALFEPKEQPEEVPPFRFPTVPPSIRRILQPTVVDRAVQLPRPISHENLDGPLKKYDIVLGNLDTKYPKIFRFNEERMNIVDFEKQKKMELKLADVSPNSISGTEPVPREQFLILHGGIFTVQEPPLYNQNGIRKRKLARQHNFYKSAKQ